jgi:hypothetical protein
VALLLPALFPAHANEFKKLADRMSVADLRRALGVNVNPAL